MKDWAEWLAASIVTLGAALLVFVVFYALYTQPKYREMAEAELGAGAVCGQPDDSEIACVRKGREYICITHRDRVACALKIHSLEAP